MWLLWRTGEKLTVLEFAITIGLARCCMDKFIAFEFAITIGRARAYSSYIVYKIPGVGSAIGAHNGWTLRSG